MFGTSFISNETKSGIFLIEGVKQKKKKSRKMWLNRYLFCLLYFFLIEPFLYMTITFSKFWQCKEQCNSNDCDANPTYYADDNRNKTIGVWFKKKIPLLEHLFLFPFRTNTKSTYCYLMSCWISYKTLIFRYHFRVTEFLFISIYGNQLFLLKNQKKLFYLTVLDMPVFIRVPHLEPLHPSLQPSSQTPVMWLQDPLPLQ